LKQKAHDLFDPIWREDRLVSRKTAYVLLAAKLGVPEPQAHFKQMPRHRIEQAIALLPDLRAQIRRSLGTGGGGPRYCEPPLTDS
jgi:hypothetical protein